MMDLDLSTPETPLPEARKSNDPMTHVFAYVESICVTKQNIMLSDEDEKRYGKFRWLIHRALSQIRGLVPIVNLINAAQNMPVRMEYEFFLNFVPVTLRRPKWAKKSPKSVYLPAIQQHYGYNERKAEEALRLLSIEQLTMIDTKTRKKEDQWTFSGDMESK